MVPRLNVITVLSLVLVVAAPLFLIWIVFFALVVPDTYDPDADIALRFGRPFYVLLAAALIVGGGICVFFFSRSRKIAVVCSLVYTVGLLGLWASWECLYQHRTLPFGRDLTHGYSPTTDDRLFFHMDHTGDELLVPSDVQLEIYHSLQDGRRVFGDGGEFIGTGRYERQERVMLDFAITSSGNLVVDGCTYSGPASLMEFLEDRGY